MGDKRAAEPGLGAGLSLLHPNDSRWRAAESDSKGPHLGNWGIFQFAKKEAPLVIRKLATWEPQSQA